MSLIHQQKMLKTCFSVKCVQFSSIIFNISTRNRFCTDTTSNPLRNIGSSHHKLPSYRRITGEVVKNTIPLLVDEAEKNFKQYEEVLRERNKSNYTWKNVITQSELIFDEFELAWSAVLHLNGVCNNPSLRVAHENVQPLVVSMVNKISQSKPVFEALKYLESQNHNFSSAQNRIIKSSIKGARNSGVHLEGKDKEEFNEISQKLAELSTKFMNNVLDSTKEFSYTIYDKKDTEGLPDTLLALMASKTLNRKIDPITGPWKLSLDMPCFQPFMMYSANQDLRKMAYLAYISRASRGESDNSNIIETIRELRRRKSLLLGFKKYSLLSLDSKMAQTPDAVWEMISNLKEKAKPVAAEELVTLKEFALNNGHKGDLNQWDLAFWSEKQKELLFNFKEEELRDYFPLEKVLNGLFTLSNKLFGIEIMEEAKGAVETWHDDVRFFKVIDKNFGHIASFFVDLYARPHEKNGGAWHNSGLDRNDGLKRIPVSYLVCNQRPPVGDVPSLMTINEVRTLFHEFGHGLQHMLTQVKYTGAAGINNIEWDAVELPSQFMENWLYDWSTLTQISSHYITAEPLPLHLFEQLQKAKKYQAGMANMRQLYFAALDMELHTSDDDWQSVMSRVADKYTLMQPHPEDKFPCGFLHIFAGGYAAGYYSYKWAEVLSADAFSAFEEAGLENRKEIGILGKKFRDTILAKGGSVHPEMNFIDFRGRKAEVGALLKSYGMN